MLKPIIGKKKIEKLRQMIADSENVVITTHLSPDGDALGSSIAMMLMLSSFGKRVHIITPDVPAKTLSFIKHVKEVVPYTRYGDFAQKLMDGADLVFCLDYNTPSRVDKFEPLLLACKAPKVMIDHHTDPDDFPDLIISFPEISSTCMLLFRVFCELGWAARIDKPIAESIYVGMMTDTGNFSYNSLDPNLYTVIAELVRHGVDKDRLYRFAFNTKKESQLRLNAYAICSKMKIYPEHHAALIVLTLDELAKYNFENGDTEGLVNIPLSIPGVEYSAFIREGKEYTKISMRSVGDVPVNKFCTDHFNGGGHVNASGGEFFGPVGQAVEVFESSLDELDKYITQDSKE